MAMVVMASWIAARRHGRPCRTRPPGGIIELVADRQRIVTIVAFHRAERDGILDAAPEALALQSGHPGGKLALLP